MSVRLKGSPVSRPLTPLAVLGCVLLRCSRVMGAVEKKERKVRQLTKRREKIETKQLVVGDSGVLGAKGGKGGKGGKGKAGGGGGKGGGAPASSKGKGKTTGKNKGQKRARE